jgi:hypothetical protein
MIYRESQIVCIKMEKIKFIKKDLLTLKFYIQPLIHLFTRIAK